MLRQFRNSRDIDFVRALNIYSNNIHPAWKTNTNEITYWTDHYNSKFSAGGDKFYTTGFYSDQELIGFSEFVYVPSERLIIFDYLVIDKEFRSMGTFYQFIESLRRFIETERLIFDYVVSEIGYLSNGIEPSRLSQTLIRLFKIANGGVVKAPYYQPSLGLGNDESKMRGVLLLFSFVQIESITRETYLRIVRCIYYDHYLRWYSIYENTTQDYLTEITELLTRLESETDNTNRILINGYHPGSDMVSGKRNPRGYMLGFVTYSLLFILFLTTVMIKVQKAFDMPLITFIALYLVAVLSFFSVLAIFSKNAFLVFNKLLLLFKSLVNRIR